MAIALEGYENTIVAGTSRNGVYILNAGIWSTINTGLINSGELQIYSLVLNGTTIFAGTGSGLFSYNGSTWSYKIGTGKIITCLSSNSANIYGINNSGIGTLYISTNGGSTWYSISPGVLGGGGLREIIDLGNNDIIVTQQSTQANVWYSSNNGSTLSKINSGITAITYNSLCLINGNVYLACPGSSPYTPGIFETTNYSSWSNIGLGPEIGSTTPISLATDGTTLYASIPGSGVYNYSNGNWTQLPTTGLDLNINTIAAINGTLLVGTTDNGIYLYNGYNAWTSIGPIGLPVTSIISYTSPTWNLSNANIYDGTNWIEYPCYGFDGTNWILGSI